jgi:enamine deaminase RidA (YjgF/YER057c/UK114 family)
MFKSMNPDGVAPPRRNYVHSIEVPPNCRWLSLSGQVGVAPDGTIPDGITAQTEHCWANNLKILEANGMGIENIVKVVQYLTRVEDRDAHFVVRDRYLGDHKPTSTLLFVPALAEPNFVVEVEISAAKPL